MSLAESLERAACELGPDADDIRPANGDPSQLLTLLDAQAAERVLGWLLINEPQAGEELAIAWLDEEGGPAAVVSASTAKLPKAGRKVLRRVLHGARSRGIGLGLAERAVEQKVGRLPSLNENLDAAYVCPHDPRGSRLVYVIMSHPAGGARIFEALLDDERGIADFRVYRTGRTQVRDFVRDVTRRERYAAIAADGDAVRALIARALAAHPADRPLPRAMNEWKRRLLAGAEGAATPGEIVAKELGLQEPEPADLEALVALVRSGDIGPWPPPANELSEAIEPLQAKFAAAGAEASSAKPEDAGEASTQQGAPAPAPEDVEAHQAELVAALTPLYAGDFRDRLAARFEDVAYLKWRGEESGQARACLASAAALRSGDIEACPAVQALIDELASHFSGRGREPASAGDAQGGSEPE